MNDWQLLKQWWFPFLVTVALIALIELALHFATNP
jgi:hypothetical protein